MPDTEQLEQAMDDIVEWLDEHEAHEISQNLAPPATKARIAACEKRIGPFPEDLRALYLRHDGQRDRDEYPLFEAYAFTDLEYGRLLHEGLLMSYLGLVPGAKELDRSRVFPDPAAPLLDGEYSRRWWPVGEANGQMIAVNLDTGRVFQMLKDVPAVRLLAADVSSWVAGYADALWNDAYEIAGDPSLPGVSAEGMIARRKHVARR